jgi:hypothetical protein
LFILGLIFDDTPRIIISNEENLKELDPREIKIQKLSIAPK